jgi:transcriptional regulator with XRE-family HTH domain
VKLGELIAIGRECKGWTLRELERESGVSNALISQIETGKVKEPSFTNIVRLTEALGISVERAAKIVSLTPLRKVLRSSTLSSTHRGSE